MFSAIVLPLAKADIQDSARWYEKQQQGLGKRFINQVREKIRLIEKFPKAARLRNDRVRTAVLETFPFMIHYYIDEDKKLVIISAVLHTSRNPKVWKAR
ncbi:MAG: type II toxin-antitoxin system RelE/ParE family toxin [Bacteroidota bacterium]|nr:type II toxin-antitoxin system RelE/ParE family toxin [Bacteroidota bacterium]